MTKQLRLIQLLSWLAAATLPAACSTDDPADVSETSTSAQSDASGSAEESLHHISVHAQMVGGDQLPFLTTAGNIVQVPRAQVIGKPAYVAVFRGGTAQGVDQPLFHEWTQVDSTLEITARSPDQLPDGPYDVVVIIYTSTSIGSAQMQAEFPPVPTAGELSSFTLDQSEVREGDPGFSNGLVRVNLEGKDATLELRNRADMNDISGSFNNTLLVVP